MKDYPFLNDEEEEEFAENYRRFLAMRHPNPGRIGCPGSGIIRDFVFRKKLDPKTIDDVVSHIMKCSECALEAIEYAEEYRQTSKKKKE